MSLSLNRVHLAGNLTRDPQVRFLANEKAVAEFGIAINRTWKDASGQKHEEATFVDLEAFAKQAETIGQYFKKGDPIYIEGRLKLDTWDDKQTGQKRSKMKVVVDSWQFAGSRRDGDAPPAESTGGQPRQRRPAAPALTGGVRPDGSDEPPF